MINLPSNQHSFVNLKLIGTALSKWFVRSALLYSDFHPQSCGRDSGIQQKFPFQKCHTTQRFVA